MHVIAVVVVDGSRHAVDVLTPVAGVPMVARSVRAVLASGVADRVLLAAGDRTAEVLRACVGLDVTGLDAGTWLPHHTSFRRRAHVGQRSGATVGDGRLAEGRDDVVIVHDAARPLTSPALFAAVREGIGHGHTTVVPVLPLVDTVKIVDGGLLRSTPDRAGLRVVQSPHAFRGPVTSALLDVPAARAANGEPVHTVVGDPLAFPVRTPWDLELAELLVEGL